MTSTIATTETLILGNGLAATLLATSLIEAGHPARDITLCAPNEPMASDVPGALMHPLPGSSLKPKPGVMQAYEASLARHQIWARRYPEHIHQTRMLRVTRGARRGKRYLKSYASSHHLYSPLMSHERLDEREALDLCPQLARDTEGAIVYGPTFCVALGKLLPLIREDLHLEGVKAIHKKALSIQTDKHQNPTIHLEGQTIIEASRVILACGPSLAQFFPSLELGVNGGELLVVEAPQARRHDVMISAGGHISPMPEVSPNTLVMGSSYLRPTPGMPPDDPHAFHRPDAEAIDQVSQLIANFYPSVLEANVAQLWRGRRTVYLPDKHPLVGSIPTMHNVFVLGALGSKGLLWAPLAATSLARQILAPEHAPPIPVACSTTRVPHEQWLTTNHPISSQEAQP